MKIIEKKESVDKKTIKYLQLTDDNIITETAYVNDCNKHIICFASQLGCPIACAICYNGVNPNYFRNLTKEEIVEQCTNVFEDRNLDKAEKQVFFSCKGIGEALLNYDNVVFAMLELNKKYPGNRFDLATTGVHLDLIPKLAKDLQELTSFKLTISLHGANDELRKKLIPIHTSLLDLKAAVEGYKKLSKHEMEWNYVLLDGINDSDYNAFELVNYLEKGDKLRLTVFSEVEGCQFRPSKNMLQFKKILEGNGILCKIFEPDGKDIGAGCGQMVTHYNYNKDCL